MPRKKTPEQLRRSKLRALHHAVKVVEKQLNDPETDKIRIAPLAKSLAALHRQSDRLEKEQTEPTKRSGPGRPKLAVRLIGTRRKLNGSQYALWQTADGQDILVDLAVNSDKLTSREQAESLTRQQAEKLAADAAKESDKPQRTKEDWKRGCRLLGCPGCRWCKDDDDDGGSPAPVPAPAVDSTPVADAHGDDPADPLPVEAQSEPDPSPVPDADASPAVERADDGSEIAKLKTEVERLRDQMLFVYASFAQTMSLKIAADFSTLQAVFLTAADRLKALSPSDYAELLNGYDVLLSPSAPDAAKPILSEAVQFLREAQWAANTRPKKQHDDEPRGPLGSWTKF